MVGLAQALGPLGSLATLPGLNPHTLTKGVVVPPSPLTADFTKTSNAVLIGALGV